MPRAPPHHLNHDTPRPSERATLPWKGTEMLTWDRNCRIPPPQTSQLQEMGGATPLTSGAGRRGEVTCRRWCGLGTTVRTRAGMSVLMRLAPFVRGGGRLFGGLRLREAGGGGVRHAGGGVHIEPQYRQFPQLTRSQVLQAEFFSGTMWFWILWRLWHDSDAVLASAGGCLSLVCGRGEGRHSNSLSLFFFLFVDHFSAWIQ